MLDINGFSVLYGRNNPQFDDTPHNQDIIQDMIISEMIMIISDDNIYHIFTRGYICLKYRTFSYKHDPIGGHRMENNDPWKKHMDGELLDFTSEAGPSFRHLAHVNFPQFVL